MTAGGNFEIQQGDAWLGLGKLIHEALTEVNQRLDRIERARRRADLAKADGIFVEYPEYVTAAWDEWVRQSPQLAPWSLLTPEQRARFGAVIGVAVELAP